MNAPKSTINMINAFLDWAQQQPNGKRRVLKTQHLIFISSFTVWIVSNIQLLEWVRNPVPVSQLNNFAPLKCTAPQIDASQHICNGIPQNEAGLLAHCPFSDFPFYTCVSFAQISWLQFFFKAYFWMRLVRMPDYPAKP